MNTDKLLNSAQRMQDALQEADAVSRRVSTLSRKERLELQWAGMAMIYHVKCPSGVNPDRLKAFRRRIARDRTRWQRFFKHALRAPTVRDDQLF